MDITEAIGAQGGIMVLLDNLEGRHQEVSEFVEAAVGMETAIYGGDGDIAVALQNASALGETIDQGIRALIELFEQRSGHLIIAQHRGNHP